MTMESSRDLPVPDDGNALVAEELTDGLFLDGGVDGVHPDVVGLSCFAIFESTMCGVLQRTSDSAGYV